MDDCRGRQKQHGTPTKNITSEKNEKLPTAYKFYIT